MPADSDGGDGPPGDPTPDPDDALYRRLGRAWADEAPYAFLTELCEIGNRMGGHPGEARAAELVARAFEDAGLAAVSADSFDVQRWDRGSTELAVVDPVERSFEAIALPYSPPGDVQAPIVDLGPGTPDDVEAAGVELEGAIALASSMTPESEGRFVHRMEKYGHAVAAGARAFVFRNHVPGQLPPTGSLRFDAEAAVPGVGVSAETGDWLADYADRGARVRLRVDAATERGTSQNVHGTLGPDTDDEIVVLGHYDAHDVLEGALDNGCGITIVVTVAHLLADLELGCRVRLAGVGCEEVGLVGAEALAADLDSESVRAVVNVDGAGRARNLHVMTHTSADLQAAVEATADAWGQPASVDDRPQPYSDHWPFLRAGVPAVQLFSEPPEGKERGRGWGHTTADTRDKVDPRDLRSHATLTALLVRRLSFGEAPARIDRDALRERLVDRDLDHGMRAADIWPGAWD